jgi:uncharacterized OB-fold protein
MGQSSRVLSIYDRPMWESIARHKWALQCCSGCAAFRYPPSPICAECGSLDYEWKEVAGVGTILSWVVVHRKYFDDHPTPYNAVAVRLDEGPTIMSNLVGDEPEGGWIGRRVRVEYEARKDYVLPVVRLDETA